MARYIVPFTTYANTSVIVDAPEGATQDEIVDLAEQRLNESMPSLCHQCVGGRHGNPELDLGDDWQVPETDGVYDIDRLDG